MKEPLKVGDHGPYGTLSDRPLPAALSVVFMPALSALLEEAEHIKGSPLTEEQVLLIRDGAAAVVAPADVVSAVVNQRGYAEVDPTNAWQSWQAIRLPS